jgi:hypothetical protein
MEAAAPAVNVAVVAPANTVNDAGTVNSALLLATVTVDPPVGAVCVRVTVQVLVALWPRLAGLHVTPDTAGTAITPDPPDETAIASPAALTPTRLETPTVVLLPLDARVI